MQRKIKLNNRELTFDLPTEADQSVFDEIFRDKEYRVVEDILINAKDTVLDLGAHIGLFSIYASVLNGGKASLFVFEPDEINFAAMKEHLKLNGVKNIQCKNVAVAAESGERELFLSADSHNHSLIGEGVGKKIRTTTLPDIIRKFRLEKIDLVKMDIEGAEFEVLESMEESDFAKIANFYVEYHEYANDKRGSDLMRLLAMNNYRVERRVSNYDNKMGYLVARNGLIA
jgi:FkbM family methyltransferase